MSGFVKLFRDSLTPVLFRQKSVPAFVASVQDIRDFIQNISDENLELAGEQLNEFKNSCDENVLLELTNAADVIRIREFKAKISRTAVSCSKGERDQFLSMPKQSKCSAVQIALKEVDSLLNAKETSAKLLAPAQEFTAMTQQASKRRNQSSESGKQPAAAIRQIEMPKDAPPSPQAATSKMDMSARVAITGSLMYLCGPIAGLKGAAIAFGVEKSLGWLGFKLASLVKSQPERVSFTPVSDYKRPVPPTPTAKPAPILSGAQDDCRVKQVPLGLVNETGNDCFINAYLQAVILDDPVLMEAILRSDQTDEIAQVIRAYQGAKDGAVVGGSRSIRTSLARHNVMGSHYRSGQHDPTEAFGFLHSPSVVKHSNYQAQTIHSYWSIPKGMSKEGLIAAFIGYDSEVGEDSQGVYTIHRTPDFNGQVQVIYQKGVSLEEMILQTIRAPHEERDLPREHCVTKGIHKAVFWEKVPTQLTFGIGAVYGALGSTQKNPIYSVNGTLLLDPEMFPDRRERQYELTSFVQHWGETGAGGHYVAYVKRGNNYYLCNDLNISCISREEFFAAAVSNESIALAKYTLARYTETT